MTITKNIEETVKAHALESGEDECCGLLVKNKGELIAIKCKNTVPEKERKNKFQISVDEYVEASIKYEDLVGVYHSHPQGENCEFSETDKKVSSALGICNLLYVPKIDKFSLLEQENEK